MTKNKEFIGLRIPASLKSTIDKIPTDNSKWVRNVLQREVDRREKMKDERKKESPAKIERLKELNSEISNLEKEFDKQNGRLEEIRETVDRLENELAKKKSLKENIMSEVENETEMDQLMIKQVTGDL